MKPINLKVKTKSNTYPIIVGSSLLKNINKLIKKNSLNFNRCLIVIDTKVPKKFLNQIMLSLSNKKKNNLFF